MTRSLASLSTTRLAYAWTRLKRRIWFRAATISAGAFALVGLSSVISRYIAFDVDIDVGQDAVGTILEIIASSMLAVTTFSLTAMVTAYGSATQLATPRATQLLIGDVTSQNALSTFLGAFVFSVVGIIGLQTEIYGQEGRLVLFAGTLVLVLVVVATLLRWISHLMTFGRMADVIDRVEDAAADAMRAYRRSPRGGARPEVAIPPNARPLFCEKIGYVNHVDLKSLKAASAEHAVALHLVVRPGALVHPTRPVLFVDGALDEEVCERLLDAFSVERHRTFDHDPRLGIIALSEIGSRALAPATNDPGTAIEVLNAMLRVLLLLRPTEEEEGRREAARPQDDARVHMPGLSVDDLLEDAFAPLLREGAGEGEVAIRLTKTLAALRDGVPGAGDKVRALAEGLADLVRLGPDTLPLERARFERCHGPLWEDRAPD